MIILFLVLFVLILLLILYISADIRSGVYINAILQLPAKGKKIALTFDDGPHPEITPLILTVLKKYNVPATFFCIGENIEKYKSLAERIIDDGHVIGNHTHRHSYFFPFFSRRRMKEEINACEDQIISVSPAYPPMLFRPPFGITNPSLKKALKSSGYSVIGWSIRSYDTILNDPVHVFKRVTKRIEPGSIILFHDSQFYTPEIIERVIIFAQKKGYNFVRLDEKGIEN